MHRFFVIEARRLLPLLFLLVLLVSLSIYDNFFREQPVVVPGDNTENIVTFITYDRGELPAVASFQVIATATAWNSLKEEHTGLPDYPFNDAYEFAVSALNSEIENIRVFPQEDGSIQVQVKVSESSGVYHVVTVDRERVGERSRWIFLDEADRILQEIVISPDGEHEETVAGENGAEK